MFVITLWINVVYATVIADKYLSLFCVCCCCVGGDLDCDPHTKFCMILHFHGARQR